jgi:hypothetical protein
VATQKKSKRAETSINPDWMLLEAFAIEEGLTYSDFYRLGRQGLLPRIETTDDGTPWVHRKSLIDWRLLLEVHDFKTFRRKLPEMIEKEKAERTVEPAN